MAMADTLRPNRHAETYEDSPLRHRLSHIDKVKRSGTCSICGPVRIFRNGKYYMCGVKKAELRRAWFNKHGRKAKPSPHALLQKDPVTRLGVCPIDGPVEIVPFARGWACKIRADELGGGRAEPAKKCYLCGKYDSQHNPVSSTELRDMCEGCARLMHSGPTPARAEQAEATAVGAAFDRSPSEGGNLGAHMVSNFDWLNPDYMPDYESVVPGWKTLGAK